MEAVQFIQSKIENFIPEIGLILGSGLGFFADQIDKQAVVPYNQIPTFPESTVEGHKGNLVFGTVHNKNILCMQGRFHYYEGYSIEQVTKPIRTMHQLGIKTLILTNAAGGINDQFEPGDLMVIKDHINMMGTNPLIGSNDNNLGPRFPDMSTAYNKDIRQQARDTASKLNLKIHEGVYLAATGPSYETPAEIQFYKAIGADAVGMSTVPEVLVARHAGIRVGAISCITNKAAGLSDKPLSHEEVTQTANKVKEHFAGLISELIAKI